MPKDPVCGMDVMESAAAARVRHAGIEHLFCSKGCAEKFRAHPERYVSAAPRTSDGGHSCCSNGHGDRASVPAQGPKDAIYTIPIMRGSTEPGAEAITLARGLTPNFAAVFAAMITIADPASFNPEAFPAVIVPSFLNTGLS